MRDKFKGEYHEELDAALTDVMRVYRVDQEGRPDTTAPDDRGSEQVQLMLQINMLRDPRQPGDAAKIADLQARADAIELDRAMRPVKKEKPLGSGSPSSGSMTEKSMVLFLTRGGVPVLSRPRVKPRPAIDSASATAAGSLCRPAARDTSPTCTRPLRNVPVVTTTRLAATRPPPSIATPVTCPFDTSNRSTCPYTNRSPGVASSASRTHAA